MLSRGVGRPRRESPQQSVVWLCQKPAHKCFVTQSVMVLCTTDPLRSRRESNSCVAVLQTAVFPLHHWTELLTILSSLKAIDQSRN